MSFTLRAARLVQLLVVLILCPHIFDCTAKVISDTYSIHLLAGRDIAPLAEFIAGKRVEIFRDYPYLYEGEIEEELSDINVFMNLPHSIVVVAYDNEQPIGYVTGVPLKSYLEQFFLGSMQAVKNHSLDLDDYYYLAEIIVLPEYRENGLAGYLFGHLEEYAYQEGFGYVSFVSKSHEQHPLKPYNYKELGQLWRHFGYTKTDITLCDRWNTLQASGPAQYQDHGLPLWIKKL